MEGFYVVFDRARKRIGFAVSACHGESATVWGQSIHVLPVQQSVYLGPWVWEVVNNCLRPESTYCAKARVSAYFFGIAWHGDPCLDWEPLLETQGSNSCLASWETIDPRAVGEAYSDPGSCSMVRLNATSEWQQGFTTGFQQWQVSLLSVHEVGFLVNSEQLTFTYQTYYIGIQEKAVTPNDLGGDTPSPGLLRG